MAEDLIIGGTTYPAVPSVVFNKAGGGTATYTLGGGGDGHLEFFGGKNYEHVGTYTYHKTSSDYPNWVQGKTYTTSQTNLKTSEVLYTWYPTDLNRDTLVTVTALIKPVYPDDIVPNAGQVSYQTFGAYWHRKHKYKCQDGTIAAPAVAEKWVQTSVTQSTLEYKNSSGTYKVAGSNFAETTNSYGLNFQSSGFVTLVTDQTLTDPSFLRLNDCGLQIRCNNTYAKASSMATVTDFTVDFIFDIYTFDYRSTWVGHIYDIAEDQRFPVSTMAAPMLMTSLWFEDDGATDAITNEAHEEIYEAQYDENGNEIVQTEDDILEEVYNDVPESW